MLENNKNIEKLNGQIETVTYHDEKSGFSILRIEVQSQKDSISAVGSIVNPVEGEQLVLKGYWDKHKKYGMQFKFDSYQPVTPVTTDSICKYLGSGLINGIGPEMAKRMVAAFGEETLNIIEKHPDRLNDISGIGPKRIEKICAAWEEQREVRSIMIFLNQYGVGATYATKIYKMYGGDAIKIIQSNPYRLATEIHGIGFKKADVIAMRIGFPKESDFRIEAGIVFVLQEMSGQGNVCYPYMLLIERAAEILGVNIDLIKDGVSRSTGKDSIVIDETMGSTLPVYLKTLYIQETTLGKKLSLLQEVPRAIRLSGDTRALVQSAQQKLKINLAPNQQKAVEMALSEKFSIISGGPGTGKTTLIKSILSVYEKTKATIMLAAPTGRAAKRMSEATGYEAKTIHRLLSFQNGAFEHNEDDPLNCDLVIIDEASMIDLSLMYHLVRAIPGGAVVVLVGDIYQLPSVGAGNVLKDLIESNKLPVMILTEIFRQAQESNIITNAHRINSGLLPKVLNQKGDDFFFILKEDPEELLGTIIELVDSRIPDSFGFNPVEDIQVLTPMHKGVIGAENLNAKLQETLNPFQGESRQITRAGRVFRIGDKVLQTKNNYDLDVFNGDVGYIDRIDRENSQVVINYDDREVKYEMENLDELTMAYAITVHKSQGSEYPVIIMPVSTAHFIMLQRNLVYTGVTRGKQLVILVGTQKAMAMAVKNNQTKKRHSFLKHRLEITPSAPVQNKCF